MSSRDSRSRNRRDRAFGRLANLECLEARLPLAGNVTAELVGTTLHLTGDELANEVLVASASGGRVAVFGLDTTINGSPNSLVTGGRVTSIKADFQGGDDAVGFGNSAQDYANARLFTMLVTSPGTVWLVDQEPPSPFDVAALQAAIDEGAGGMTTFSIPGNLVVTTGDGNDSVGIAGDIGGRLKVSLGAAVVGNGLVIGSESTAGRVGGGVMVKAGGQADLVAIGNVAVAGTVSASLGDGMNWMLVASGPETPTTIGSLSYRGGANVDGVALSGDVTVRKDVRIVTGPRDAAHVAGSVSIDGSDDDAVDLSGNIRVGGSVSVITGGGADTVSIASSIGLVTEDGGEPVQVFDRNGSCRIARDLAISTGDGRDVVSIGPSTIGGNAIIDTGRESDHAAIDGMNVRGVLTVSLGAGDDGVELRNSSALACLLYGGTGVNSLEVDAATRAGIRRLRAVQFQSRTT